jgi:UDP-2,3-diacylglucosamine hydrolase
MTTRLTNSVQPSLGKGGGSDIAIIAGSGLLPELLAQELQQHGTLPIIMAITGEAGDWTANYPGFSAKTVEVSRVVKGLRALGVKRVVMAGGVGGRPDWSAIRPDRFLLSNAAGIYRALRSGDDGLLRIGVALLAKYGMTVVGAHEIMPDLLTQPGTATHRKPDRHDRIDMSNARHAAYELGRLDIGQGAVAVGGRVVAVEGAEGTDSMLKRVKEMRESGRISARAAGVLVKVAKPAQEMRADLPSIGPDTIDHVMAAGLAGIAMEADRSLILNFAETIRRANEKGIFLHGIAPGEAS